MDGADATVLAVDRTVATVVAVDRAVLAVVALDLAVSNELSEGADTFWPTCLGGGGFLLLCSSSLAAVSFKGSLATTFA